MHHFHPFSIHFPLSILLLSRYPIVILLVPHKSTFFPGADAAPGVLRGLCGGLGIETLPMPWAELGGVEAEKPPGPGCLGGCLGWDALGGTNIELGEFPRHGLMGGQRDQFWGESHV